MTTHDQPLLLRATNLGKRYGTGCLVCEQPPADPKMRRCEQCNSLWGCYGVDLDLFSGEILGIVGESGSGKSSILRILYLDERPNTGSAWFYPFRQGTQSMFEASSQERRSIRNHSLGMVYQNPFMGLRMMFSSSGNVAEKLMAADWSHVGEMRTRARNLLERMEISPHRIDEAPITFSGGMQQRVQIARALANHPPLLLLDEVTSGLDLSVQAKVLDLIRQIQREMNIGMIVVSHDLGVIRLLTDRTLVMKDGEIIEQGLTDQILQDPQHQYTQLLVHSLL
jgi:putative phosphonate transport system ATP-binding protein